MDTVTNWSANEWEEYLLNLEVEESEPLLESYKVVEAMPDEYYKSGFSELIGTNYSEKLEKVVELLMATLTQKQKHVLQLIYWESMTVNEVATYLGISHSGVKDLRDRALAKLAKVMMEHRGSVQNETRAA